MLRREAAGVGELDLLGGGVGQFVLVDEHHALRDLVGGEHGLEVREDLVGADRVVVVARGAQHHGLAEQRMGHRHDRGQLEPTPQRQLRLDLDR